ncbi:MAG: DUF3617 family protein [Hyphomonadaceae bacterium]
MSFFRYKHIIMGAAFATVFSTPALAQDTFEVVPGNWTTDIVVNGSMDVDGQKIPFPIRNISEDTCITPAQAVLSKDQMLGLDEESGCEATNFSVAGDTLSVGMGCNVAGMTLNGQTEMTFSADRKSANGTAKMSGSGPNGETFNMSQVITFTHVGTCTAE